MIDNVWLKENHSSESGWQANSLPIWEYSVMENLFDLFKTHQQTAERFYTQRIPSLQFLQEYYLHLGFQLWQQTQNLSKAR